MSVRRRLGLSLVCCIIMAALAACGSGGSSSTTLSKAAATAGMGPGMMASGGAPRMMGRGSGSPPPTVTIAPTVAPSSSAPDSFSRDVLPILTSQCGSCHGGQDGLWLTTYEQVMVGGTSGPVVVPGKPDQSLLYQRVTG